MTMGYVVKQGVLNRLAVAATGLVQESSGDAVGPSPHHHRLRRHTTKDAAKRKFTIPLSQRSLSSEPPVFALAHPTPEGGESSLRILAVFARDDYCPFLLFLIAPPPQARVRQPSRR